MKSSKKCMEKQKIYDCFTFFNELDLLELRLTELDDVVDYFVIVEASKTFSGKEKPFYFLENKQRYKKWLKKIIYIPLKRVPKITPIVDNEILCRLVNRVDKKKLFRRFKSALSLGRFRVQTFQRNKILEGLKECNPNDIILVSDLDEIPNKKKFNQMKLLLKNSPYVGFEQTYYAYYLNGLVLHHGKEFKGAFTKCCLYRDLKKTFKSSPQNLRIKRKYIFFGDNKDLKIIKNGGWHLTYLGGESKILEKMDNLSENGFNKKRAMELIKQGYFGEDLSLKIKYLKNLDYLPESILKNKSKWKRYIKN